MSNFKSISQQFTHGYTIPSVDIESPDQSRYKILINGLASPDLSPVSEGSRNSTLARLAGIWIAEGRTLQDALYSAHEWNMGNNPPLSAAEVETTVRSIAATHERNHGVIGKDSVKETLIDFQNGPVKETGVNGIFVEDLLTIAVARLEYFQSGEFPSELNEQAIKFIKAAHQILNERTRERIERGVDGLSKK